MIVVDANILLFAVGPSPQTELFRRLIRRDHRWIAPVLWRSEFRNALAGYIRRGDETEVNGTRIVAKAQRLLESEIEPDTESVLRLVVASTCSAYDLEYVATAIDRGLQLVTLDKQVLREFPSIAVHPADFLS